MKKILQLVLLTFITSISLLGQAPQKFSYQAVVRNPSNQLFANQQVGVKISILQGSTSGNVVYSETHLPTTNANGLVNLEIGVGNTISGVFSQINWESGTYFIKSETDLNGGSNYTISSSQQLISVPYALESNHANSVSFNVSLVGDTLYTGGGNWLIIPGISSSNPPQQNICDLPNVFNGSLNYNSVTDIDGNVYKTIVIGAQEWMAENLRVTHYRNGELIPNLINDIDWLNTTIGAWCNYSNNEEYDCGYGKLYNSYAVLDERMLCPIGYRIPNEFDREGLFTLLNFNLAGSKMKSIDTYYWNQPNLGSTNSSGFSGLPGGVRSNSGGGGNFHELGNAGWFIFKNSNDNSTFFRGLINGADIFEGTNAVGYYNYFTNVAGASVRCIKE